LPYVEDYNEQKKARNPYLCLPCNKKFTKSSLSSHVKTKHKSAKAVRVKCCLCQLVFDRHNKAQDHVASHHQVYSCTKANCNDKFSEFDRLKAHLKTGHEGSEWPWICGFCDLVLLYDLEFEVHIKQHTDKSPFACPLCSRLFSDNSRLREHLARQHLPSKDGPDYEQPQSQAQLKYQKQQAQLQQQQIEAFERLRTAAQVMTDRNKNNSAASVPAVSTSSLLANKDEAAMNREIAALLLNLHASSGVGGTASNKDNHTNKIFNVPKPEDLSLKSSVETAIDLTKSKPEITLTPTMPASITKLVKGHSNFGGHGGHHGSTSVAGSGVTVTKTNIKTPNYQLQASNNSNIQNYGNSSNTSSSSATAAASYPFYPSLASMTSLSPTLAMNSNYLLQNLLLGKMQQIASNSAASATPASTTSVSSNMASLPTQPLPAQALSLPTSKPPASVLKSATSIGGYNLQLMSEAAAAGAASGGSGNNSAANIPYLCGQIVTLLNGLLFHQHNLNNATVELNLQTQLSAIYTRLQEVVAMVEQAKKLQETKSTGSKKEDKHLKDTKQKEEDKIAKHIQEYQRALLKQHEAGKEAADSMASLLKKQPHLEAVIQQQQQQVDVVDSMEDAESAAAMKSRRRGRPPKNSNLDLSYSPPEKRSRPSMEMQLPQPAHQQPESSSTMKFPNAGDSTPVLHPGAGHHQHQHNGGGHPAVAASASGGSGKGGKGIRNRVFCGECAGCLKNDDCGKCRYCKDKTKFGGQNRLRQKCLHRRCQLDTHRRRASQNSQNNGLAGGIINGGGGMMSNGGNSSFENASNNITRQSPSPDTIYSGVDLARLTNQSQALVIDTSVVEAAKKQNAHQLTSGDQIVRGSGQPAFPQGNFSYISTRLQVGRPRPQTNFSRFKPRIKFYSFLGFWGDHNPHHFSVFKST
jgi:hypothetical protein